MTDKPFIGPLLEPFPTEPTVTDERPGTGPEAEIDSLITMNYVEVVADTGQVFDSTWARGGPVTLSVDTLVMGWRQSMIGMQVGGRRRIVLPPDDAYGWEPGHALSGKTLVIVVDLLRVDAQPDKQPEDPLQ